MVLRSAVFSLALASLLLAGCVRMLGGQAPAGDGSLVPSWGDGGPDASPGDAGAVDDPPGLYGPCGAGGGCPSASLSCVRGEVEVCLRDCTQVAGACGADEECELYSGSQSWCTPSCSSSDPCPGGMHCTGFGLFPVDHCHPNKPRSLGAACDSAALCAAGQRCLGTQDQAQGYCYIACPVPTACSAGQRCIASTKFSVCLARCEPLAPSCASHEYCWANLQLGEGVCAPGEGIAGSCDGATPCDEGTVCAAGRCRSLCSGPADCFGTDRCLAVAGSPWSACQ